jgi:sec-independent protein translocase protein TatC
MLFGNNNQPDPDDYFKDTRMSFGDHLEDLRMHLWRAVAGFAIAMIASFAIGKPVLRFISAPVEAELQKYWDKYYQDKHRQILSGVRKGEIGAGRPITVKLLLSARDMKIFSGQKPERGPVLDLIPAYLPIFDTLEIDDWVDRKKVATGYWVEVDAKFANPIEFASALKEFETLVGARPALSTLNVQEGFLVYFKVSLVAGFVLASPWIFYQIWSFVAAGLYPHEKRYVNVFLPVSLGLFLAGVFVCQFFVIPKAVEALLWFNEWLELEPNFRLNEWLGFAIFMPLVFGLSFQTPLVMLFLERIGILAVDHYRSKRRIAWFVMAVFAAVITPSTDAFSMLFLWVPMSLLYELGILLCIMSPKRPTFDLEVPESEELIEV